eukprot:6778564-Prymnesium_polylepis.1
MRPCTERSIQRSSHPDSTCRMVRRRSWGWTKAEWCGRSTGGCFGKRHPLAAVRCSVAIEYVRLWNRLYVPVSFRVSVSHMVRLSSRDMPLCGVRVPRRLHSVY